ncbi:MerR family transcriptional regulator [Pseudonocardia petroleophila]|uniref:MerR family transcriptional regulator n=1 Tax=Pseudonocardia petroleophila TaxID=37331 RepID=A0A7G7MGE8_9PSEU|nr:MerR family transcriptional regulator [Pseudonocardia petroleophila]QNG51859.1 MerR family transcriptional regulator [Pseudonocardia petroleophila]
MDGLMPIGAFARLARLTVKAVRHYDAEGLLAPAHVDPHSAYRYYRADQVRTATTIAVLRGMDVPLPVVREVLAAPDTDAVSSVLAREREKLREELARREEVLRNLDGLLRRPERVQYDVAITERDAQGVTGVSGVVRAASIDDDTGALWREACALTTSRTPLVAVFPLDLADEFETLVGLPGPASEGAHAVLPAGPWATTLHVGPYPELPMAYTALLEHVRERGHVPLGPVTETYLAGPDAVEAEDLVTRLAVALTP